jgi:Na+-driven multidrug efflux pump
LAFVPIGFIALALFVMPTIVLAAMGVTGDAPPGAVMAARMAAIGILAESGAILYMHALYGIDQAKVVAMVSIIGYWGVYMATVYGLGRYTTSSYGMWIGYLIFQLIHFAAFRMIWRGQSKNCIRVAIPAQHS